MLQSSKPHNSNNIICQGDKAADGVGATIHVDSVSLLPGADECVKAGVFSTLHPQVSVHMKRSSCFGFGKTACVIRCNEYSSGVVVSLIIDARWY